MESVKNAALVKFLRANDFKTKCIKLAILLLFMSMGYVSPIMACMGTVLCVCYTIFEFSADSIMWCIISSIHVPYTSIGLITILMWVYTITLLIKLIIDIKNKKINYKNWRFITLVSLLFAIILMLMLPVSVTYILKAQFNKIVLFLAIFFTILYVKDVKVRDLFILFSISIMFLCAAFYVISLFDPSISVVIGQNYSKGVLNRFSAFYDDPNFCGAIVACAMMTWFMAYKKEFINKYLYFCGLAVLGVFLLMTISKSCYIAIALFALYIIVENIVITIKTKNAKHLIELAYYLAVLLIACAICWKYIDAMYQRIFNPGSGWWTEGDMGNPMSKLTTGRSVLWKDYLVAIFSSWQIILFGAGAGAGFISRGAAHSMPISYLYCYGVVNCLLMVTLFIVLVLPYLKASKAYNFVPLCVLFLLFCSIGGISIKYIFIFVIILLSICCNSVKKINTTDDKQDLEENNQNK